MRSGKILTLVMGVACSLLLTRNIHAQTTVEWADAIDGEWSDATKWTGGVVPTANGGQQFSALISAVPDAGASYEVIIDQDLDLVEIRLVAQRARVIHQSGRVTAQIITAQGDNYILQGGQIAGATLASERNFTERGRFVVFGPDASSLENVQFDGALYVGGTASTTESTGPGTAQFTGGLQFMRPGRGIQFQGGGGDVIGIGDQTINADTPLSQIAFGQDNDAVARLSSQGGLLTIGENMLVRTLSTGQSFLGRNGEGLLNRGIVRTDRSLESLTMEGNWTNEGRLEASDGGTLNLGGSFTTAGLGAWSSSPTDPGTGIAITGALNNQNATLDLTRDDVNQLGGTLTLRGGQVVGGLVQTSGNSRFVSSSPDGTAGVLSGITLEGEIEITLGVTRLQNGLTLQNGASLQIDGDPNELRTIIEVAGTQTIGGTGELAFRSGQAAIQLTSGSTLTLGENVTVRQSGGNIAIGSTGANLINLGNILSDGAVQLSGDSVINQGLISTTAGSVVSIDAGSLTNRGNLGGQGRLNGQVLNEGIIAAGDSPGTLMIDSLAQSAMGILEFEIGGLVPGTNHDQILIDNQFQLGGILDIDLINDFNPQAGDLFNLMSWNTIEINDFQFDFTNANLQDGLAWDTSLFTTSGQLSVIAVPEPGSWVIAIPFAAWLGRRTKKRRTRSK